jgi:hypothetical protein
MFDITEDYFNNNYFETEAYYSSNIVSQFNNNNIYNTNKNCDCIKILIVEDN